MGLLDSSVLGPAADLDQGMVHKLALADLLKQITSGVPPLDQTYNAQQPSQPNVAAGAAADVGAASGAYGQPTAPPVSGPAQIGAGVVGGAPASQAPNPWAAQTIDAPPPMPMSMSGQQPQPTAPAPAVAAQPASPTQPAPLREVSLMDRLGALSRGYNSGGLIGGIAQAAGAQDPLQIQEQNQSYQALIRQGVSPETARAAVLNPEIMKQVLPTAFPARAPAIEKLGPADRLATTRIGPDGQAYSADITPGGAQITDQTPEGRRQLASQYGLNPGTLEYNAYVLNKKLPDVTPDHKAIGEADAQVLSSQHLMEDLQRAQQLSQSSYSGPGAENRAYLTSNLIPGSHPGADTTTEYSNLINSSILPALKSTFPGRITNADLTLMKELQGSASNSPQVRDAILKRGIARAQEIQAEKQAASQGLRAGTYYKPGGGPNVNPEQPQQGAKTGQPQQVGSFEEALRLPSGTPFTTPDGRVKVRP